MGLLPWEGNLGQQPTAVCVRRAHGGFSKYAVLLWCKLRVINDLVVGGDANSRKKKIKKRNKHTHTQNHTLRFSKAIFFPRKPHMLAASHVLPELLGDPTLLSLSPLPLPTTHGAQRHPNKKTLPRVPAYPRPQPKSRGFPRKRQCSATRWVALAEHTCFIFSHLSYNPIKKHATG